MSNRSNHKKLYCVPVRVSSGIVGLGEGSGDQRGQGLDEFLGSFDAAGGETIAAAFSGAGT